MSPWQTGMVDVRRVFFRQIQPLLLTILHYVCIRHRSVVDFEILQLIPASLTPLSTTFVELLYFGLLVHFEPCFMRLMLFVT